jgi:hypothetical protein
VRQFSFTDFAVNNPTTPPPGDKLDSEFDNTNGVVAAVEQWVLTSLNTDGSIRDAIIGENNLVPGLFDSVSGSIIADVQPLVDQAINASGQAEQSSQGAAASASNAQTQANAALGAATEAETAASSAAQSEGNAQTYATTATNAADDATGSLAQCTDYGLVCQAWAEHMPDTIPPNILAVMGVTGDHWSSRWWANEAATTVSDASNNLNDLGQQWVDEINQTGQSNQSQLEDQFNAYLAQFQTLYLGAFVYPPQFDAQGNPVATGAIYYNLVFAAPYVWNGTEWVAFITPSPSQVYRYIFVATAGQTLFSGTDRGGNNFTYSSANKQALSVFHKGSLLTPTDDYSEAVNEFTLVAPCAAGDIVQAWVEAVPQVSLDWQTVKLDTSVWSTNGGRLQDMNGTAVTPAAASDVFISVDGVWQDGGVDYTVSSSILTFTTPIEADAATFAIAVVPTAAGGAGPSAATTRIDTSGWVFDGSTVTYPLVDGGGAAVTPASAVNLLISLNGIWQNATIDYTTNGSLITFTTAPEADAVAFGLSGLPAFA